MSQQSNQSGFAVVEAVLVVVILALVGFTGWFVWHSKQNTDKTLNDAKKSSQGTASSKAKTPATFAECKAAAGSKVLTTSPEQCVTKAGKTFTDNSQAKLVSISYSSGLTFYDCWEQTGTFSSEDRSYSLKSSSYTYPSAYSDDMIRAFPSGKYTSELTANALSELQSKGQDDFKTCTGAQSAATIRVYNASSTFLYIGVGCDGGHRELLYSSGIAWQRIYSGQSEIDCGTVDKYKVPASILKVSGETTTCFDGTSNRSI